MNAGEVPEQAAAQDAEPEPAGPDFLPEQAEQLRGGAAEAAADAGAAEPAGDPEGRAAAPPPAGHEVPLKRGGLPQREALGPHLHRAEGQGGAGAVLPRPGRAHRALPGGEHEGALRAVAGGRNFFMQAQAAAHLLRQQVHDQLLE